MREDILAHVGRRMRLYRRSRGMSLAELGEIIGKSKASLSKYESGAVALDIATLYEISTALDVSPSQLFDYERTGQPCNREAQSNPFLRQNQLYLYHMYRKNVFFSLLRLGRSDESGRIAATMFYKSDSPDNVERCDCIYHGHLISHATIISVLLTNYHNAVENILLNFTIPMRKADTLTGMLSGLDVGTHAPIAYKVMLSMSPFSDTSCLAPHLAITADTYREMRHNNSMFVR